MLVKIALRCTGMSIINSTIGMPSSYIMPTAMYEEVGQVGIEPTTDGL